MNVEIESVDEAKFWMCPGPGHCWAECYGQFSQNNYSAQSAALILKLGTSNVFSPPPLRSTLTVTNFVSVICILLNMFC